MPTYIKVPNNEKIITIGNINDRFFDNENIFIQTSDLINFYKNNELNYYPKINKNDYNKHLKDYNIALVCGKNFGSNIIVVDIDFIYNDIYPENHDFIKFFGYNFINYFNTYTEKSQNGGIHLFFYYDDDFNETSYNYFLGIDLLSNGAFCLMNGSSYNNNNYEVYLNTSIKNIPNDLKEFIKYYNYNNKLNKNDKIKFKKKLILNHIKHSFNPKKCIYNFIPLKF